MTQNWEECLIQQSFVLLSKMTSTGWTNGLSNLMKFNKWKWKAALHKWPWGSLWTPSWTWARNVYLPQRRPTSPWAEVQILLVGQGKWSFPFMQHWWGHIWSTVCTSGMPSTKEVWTYWRKTTKCHEDIEALEHLSCEERLRDLGLFKGEHINVYKCLKGWCKEVVVRLFSLVSNGRTWGNRKKQTQKSVSEHHKTGFYLRVTEHWSNLSTNGCGISITGNIKKPSGHRMHCACNTKKVVENRQVENFLFFF